MNQKNKQCPLKFSNLLNSDYERRCIKEECKFWSSAYTIENIQIFDCCIVLDALKNSEGKIPV